MRTHIRALLLAVAVAVFTVLGACAPDTASSGDDMSSDEGLIKPIAAKNSGKEETVTLVLRSSDEDIAEIFGEIAEKYMWDFPNTNIEFVFEDSFESLKKRLDRSDEADICFLDGGEELELAKDGLLLDIYPYLLDWNEYDTLNKAALFASSGMGSSSSYLMPLKLYHDLLYYRADWFGDYDETGIRVPRVWEEMQPAVEQTAHMGQGLIFGGSEKLVDIFNSNVWSSVVAGRTAGIQVAYYSAKDMSKSIFTLKEAVSGGNQFLSVMQTSVPEEALYWTEEEAVEQFIDGDFAMLIADSTVWSRLQNEMGDKVGVASYPRGISGTALMGMDYSGLSVLEASDCRETAVHFLQYLSNSDNNTYFALKSGELPLHLTAPDMEPSLLDSHMSQSLNMLKSADWYQFASEPRMYSAFESYEETAYGLLRSAVSGEESVDSLLSKLDEYWNSAFEEEGMLWE